MKRPRETFSAAGQRSLASLCQKRRSYSSPVSQLDASPNYLLVRLDQEAYLRLKAHLRPVILESKQVVYPAGSRIRHVLFPETAVLCMLTLMKDGRTVESATVGREGASWISASVGAPNYRVAAFNCPVPD